MSAKKNLTQWLAGGETARVVNALQQLSREWGDPYFSRDVTHLAGRYNQLQNDRNLGISDDRFYNQQMNAIRLALQDLIEKLPDNLALKTVAPDTPPAEAPATTVRLAVSPQLPWIIGLFLLFGATIALVGFVPCPTKSVENILRLLMALGAGGIATLLPGIFRLKFKGGEAGSAIGVFALVYLFNPAGAVKDDSRCQEFSTLTVVVHGAGGIYEKILSSQGEVVIAFAEKTEKARINEEGEAIFLKIPIQWLQEPVKIYLEHPQPYQSLHPDSLYRIPKAGKVYLAAGLRYADRLFGRITEAGSGAFLNGVQVSVRNATTFTDANGWFDLQIPANIQQKFQRVTLSKPGYSTVTFDSVPVHTQQEFSYPLSKVKR